MNADLLEWQAMAQGAYSANTLRAQKSDGAARDGGATSCTKDTAVVE
jgi:hypothetical protein